MVALVDLESTLFTMIPISCPVYLRSGMSCKPINCLFNLVFRLVISVHVDCLASLLFDHYARARALY